jgi:uncharacterized protein
MTDRLRIEWPDPLPFTARNGRPVRILAMSDEPDPTLDSAQTRERLGRVDMLIGAGDLQPEYLSFVTDAFNAPLHYVRGNHDVGMAWTDTEHTLLPSPLADGRVVEEDGIRILGFSGSPRYNERGVQSSALQMWARVLPFARRGRSLSPLIVVTHAPPRGINDDTDVAHRGFTAFRWLASRLHPPLWLHGHTALVRRGLDARATRVEGTLFYNCTGATLLELVEPAASGRDRGTMPADAVGAGARR